MVNKLLMIFCWFSKFPGNKPQNTIPSVDFQPMGGLFLLLLISTPRFSLSTRALWYPDWHPQPLLKEAYRPGLSWGQKKKILKKMA